MDIVREGEAGDIGSMNDDRLLHLANMPGQDCLLVIGDSRLPDHKNFAEGSAPKIISLIRELVSQGNITKNFGANIPADELATFTGGQNLEECTGVIFIPVTNDGQEIHYR